MFKKLVSFTGLINYAKVYQIDEGVTFNVAGGLMLEHPLILPLIDTVVSLSLSASSYVFPDSVCLSVSGM